MMKEEEKLKAYVLSYDPFLKVRQHPASDLHASCVTHILNICINISVIIVMYI